MCGVSLRFEGLQKESFFVTLNFFCANFHKVLDFRRFSGYYVLS